MTSREPLRTKRPRVTAAVGLIIAVVLAAAGVALISVTASFALPASAMIALAIVCAVISVLALRVAGPGHVAPSLAVPLRVLTIVAFALGIVGIALGVVANAVSAAPSAFLIGLFAFVASLVVALQGALVYGAAAHRP